VDAGFDVADFVAHVVDMEAIVAKQANAKYTTKRQAGSRSRTASTVRQSDAITFSTARRHENNRILTSQASNDDCG
jgi:hypothetical protein